MSEESPRPISIRRRLLLFLVSSAALMVSGAAAVTYLVALHSANNAYDRSLLDPALEKSSAEAAALLDRWGRLHSVRTLLGCVSFVLLAVAVAAR